MPKKEDSKETLEKESKKVSQNRKNTSTRKVKDKVGSSPLTTEKTKKATPPKVEKEVKKKSSSKKETKNNVKTESKKSTKKASDSKVVKLKDNKKNATTKKTAEKNVDQKTVTKKETTKKVKDIEKDTKTKSVKKLSKDIKKIESNEPEKKIDEETVIEKIKNFIAKIAAMQEEAGREEIDKKESKEKKKILKKKETQKIQYSLEYYDLVYRYNETIVKILAQTPKRLFVYWDISDSDRQRYTQTFGEDFFEKTYPVLLVYNEDRKYVKEVAVNDFANSWYIDIQDSKNKYIIQLGRKFRQIPNDINMTKVMEEDIILKTDYLPLANSNQLETPNDHVLLESLPRFITFRNVKTNEELVKGIGDFKDAFGNNYSVDGFYNEQYKDEISEGMFDMANPSSNISSSSFK